MSKVESALRTARKEKGRGQRRAGTLEKDLHRILNLLTNVTRISPFQAASESAPASSRKGSRSREADTNKTSDTSQDLGALDE